MRMDVRNMLRLAAETMEDDEGHSEGGYAFCLRELAKNLEAVAQEPAKWPEFAEIYCLTPVDLDARFLRSKS
jgi:hypothetical protein